MLAQLGACVLNACVQRNKVADKQVFLKSLGQDSGTCEQCLLAVFAANTPSLQNVFLLQREGSQRSAGVLDTGTPQPWFLLALYLLLRLSNYLAMPLLSS